MAVQVPSAASDPAWQDATRIYDILKQTLPGAYAVLYVGASPYLSYLLAQDQACEGVVVVAPQAGHQRAMDLFDVGDFFEPFQGTPVEAFRNLQSTLARRQDAPALALVWDIVVAGMPPQASDIRLYMQAPFFVMRRFANQPIPESDARMWAANQGADGTVYYFKTVTPSEQTPFPASAAATPRMDGTAFLPVPIAPAERRTMEQSVLEFLQGFLPMFVKNPPVATYLAPQFQPIWIRAFTHETVDPDNNYEMLEYKGDRALDLAVNEYLMRRFPGGSKGQYNNMKSALVSKTGLQPVARDLGLADRVIKFKSTRHLEEDVVESFLGALVDVSDQLVFGLGYLNVYNFVVWYFNQKQLSLEVQGKTPYKTLVDQILSRLFTQKGVKAVLEKRTDELPGQIITNLILAPDAVDLLARQFRKTVPTTLGSGRAQDKNVSATAAYEQAYRTLESQGITVDWAEEQRRRMDFEAVGPDYQRALTKAQASGFTDIVLFKSVNMTDRAGTMAILVGVRPDGSRTTIAVGEGPFRPDAVRAAVVAYASS